MNSRDFHWKPFLICLGLMVGALIITVPLMFIGYGATIPFSVPFFFPFAVLELLLGYYTGSLFLLNPVFAPLIALGQYPAYGYYIGKAPDSKNVRKRIWVIVTLHLIAAAVALALTAIAFRKVYDPAGE